jgi:predicted short-subunit dehydrogenase-like oxidoreductase (DUF2520 family)
MSKAAAFAIIGDGRLATHLKHYFSQLDLPYQAWSRRSDPNENYLANVLTSSTHILLAISDSAIENFIIQHPELNQKMVIHFSGQLSSEYAYSAHPLMTFTTQLFNLEQYQKIPFILEQKSPDFSALLPGLTNPSYQIPKQLKSLYHALCVLSGNFTIILWQKFFSELENKFQLPKELAYPYLQQIFANLQDHQQQQMLTGPLARNDQQTITANLQALENDPFQKIYQAFVDAFTLKETK